MIAKCSPIPHGATAMSYNNKKDRAELVTFHGLPEDSTVDNFWSRMMDFQVMKRMEIKAWKPLKNTALRFELSPENKYTEDWRLSDWYQLAMEFLIEMDSVDRRPPKEGRVARKLEPTNLLHSQYVVTLHHDSKSGIRHLHILANRVDMDGYTNDAHFIGERAVEAANRITLRRGWDLATDRREENIEDLHEAATDVLKEMTNFDWDIFGRKMRDRGYEIKLKRDSKGMPRGLSFKKGNTVYKSSELGHGRDLTTKNIETTWRKLHKHVVKSVAPMMPKVVKPKPVKPVVRATVPQQPLNTKVKCSVDYNGRSYTTEIEKAALAQLDTIVSEEMANQNCGAIEVVNVAKVVILLFGCYVDGATTIAESYGGGGSPGGNWGDDRDKDDLEWLRRCARKAVYMCKPMRKTLSR